MGVVQFVNKKEALITIVIFFTVMWEFSSLELTERVYYEAGIHVFLPRGQIKISVSADNMQCRLQADLVAPPGTYNGVF